MSYSSKIEHITLDEAHFEIEVCNGQQLPGKPAPRP